MHVRSTLSVHAVAALAALSLVLVGCSSGDGTSDSTPAPASPPAVAPTADPGGGETPPAADPETTPEATPEGPAAGGDTGPAAAPGEGRFEVGGKTYALTITSCKFTTDGPTKGTFEVRGTEAGGAPFEMTQFFLGDKWSQTSVQLDLGATKIYVIRSGTREGAVPATVDGANVTWTESFRELDEAANSQVERGEGVLNLTCS